MLKPSRSSCTKTLSTTPPRPGIDRGADGIWHTFENLLRPAFSGLKVTLYDQIAEGDKVTTRKTISGKHTGAFMGAPATQEDVVINVMDIVTIKDGQYFEHWGVNTMLYMATVLARKAAELKGQ